MKCNIFTLMLFTEVSWSQRWAAQHVFQVRNTQFHSLVFVVRKTQLRSVSKFASALYAIPQLRILPLRALWMSHFVFQDQGRQKGLALQRRGFCKKKTLRGNRRYMPYTLYSLSLLFYSPSTPPPPPSFTGTETDKMLSLSPSLFVWQKYGFKRRWEKMTFKGTVQRDRSGRN